MRFLIALIVTAAFFFSLGASVQHKFAGFPKCSEIAVTGQPGTSHIYVEGEDLFLSGVVKVRCERYPVGPQDPHTPVGFGPSF